MDVPECPTDCQMKQDLLDSFDKLAFLEENWSELSDPSYINNLSYDNLRCAHCLIKTIITSLTTGKYDCMNRDIIRLVKTNMLIGNNIELYNCRKELAELEKTLTECNNPPSH